MRWQMARCKSHNEPPDTEPIQPVPKIIKGNRHTLSKLLRNTMIMCASSLFTVFRQASISLHLLLVLLTVSEIPKPSNYDDHDDS